MIILTTKRSSNMIKNLKDVFENINNIYSNVSYKLDILKSTDEKIYFTTTIDSQFFKGSALVTGIIENTGIMSLYFTFNEIDDSPKLQGLINDFNMYAMFAKAYLGTVNGKKHLEVRYTNGLELEDAQAPVLFKYFFDDLLSEDLVSHLTPMVALTK